MTTKLVEQYRKFGTFKPELTDAQRKQSLNDLDAILIGMSQKLIKGWMVSHAKGAACLPSPISAL